ncbi:MAG: hypothetical protein HC830_02225 [Bacteroidetes bacterium]|nr:hypothetical protein [Bacteroidota bacterium]
MESTTVLCKKAFSDVLVSPDLDSTKISIYVVNDLFEEKKANLLVKVLDFAGKELFVKIYPSP